MRYRVAFLSAILVLLAVGTGASTLSDLSKDLAAIARLATPAAVQIDVQRSVGDELDLGLFRVPKSVTRSVGSGFIIDSKGYILTSADVASRAKSFTVKFGDGTTAEGTLVGSDAVMNCALIRVEKTGLQALTLGDSDSLQPGMLVVTVNSQAGMANSVSLGVVAATDRTAGVGLGPVLQISGTIGPGASGGAVLDTEGRVVGITFAMFSPTSRVTPFNLPKIYVAPSDSKGSGDASEDHFSKHALEALKEMQQGLGRARIYWHSEQAQDAARAAMDLAGGAIDVARTSGSSGFAIPINRIKPVIEQLKSGKPIEHAMLGVEPVQTPDGIVLKPSPGGAAEKAGIKDGDILVSADGRVFESPAALAAYIISLRAGETVELIVKRHGKEIALSVVTVPRTSKVAPSAGSSWFFGAPKSSGKISLSLDDAGIAEVAKALSEASGKSVVVVNPETIKGKVTIHMKSTTLESALSFICDALKCTYKKSAQGYMIQAAN